MMPGPYFDLDDDDEEAAIEEVEWFDGWCEYHAELVGKNDFEGLIKHCQERIDRNPNDDHGWEAFAYAYLDAGKPGQAIALVEDRYRADPEHPLYQAVIADALRAQGKPLEAYSRVQPPQALRVDGDLVDRLYRNLKPKRKPRCVVELSLEACGPSHPSFADADLLAALQADGRFQVLDPEMLGSAQVLAR